MSHLVELADFLMGAPLLMQPEVATTMSTPAFGAILGPAPGVRAGSPARSLVEDDEADGGDLYSISGGVAFLRVHGPLTNRHSGFAARFGFTSYESVSAAMRRAARDPRVRSVLLDFDSPGGEASGAMEAADLVRAVSATKKTVALVDCLAASAAYAIAAAANRVVVKPSATVGSIGVVYLHLDRSGQMAAAGVKSTIIHAGAYKVDGNPLQALEPGAAKRIRAQLDTIYNLFATSVGRHRPQLGAQGARRTEAALFMGRKAVDAKLADEVGGIEAALDFLKPTAAPSHAPPASPQGASPMHAAHSSTADTAPPPVPSPQARQAEVDAGWAEVAAKQNARLPPGAIAPAARRSGVEAAIEAMFSASPAAAAAPSLASGRNAVPARSKAPITAEREAEIDATWGEVAASCNATLLPSRKER